jgi:YD repeat-containing protein
LPGDHENRLTSATIAGATATYQYNGDGLRTKKTFAGATTRYVWSPRNSLPILLEDGITR